MRNLTVLLLFFFSSRRRHTRSLRDWSSDVCSSDLTRAYASEDYMNQGLGIFIDGPRFMHGGDDAGFTAIALGYSSGQGRSEERRVGKVCRSRWSPYLLKNN